MYDVGVMRELAEAVEEVQIPVCGDDIAEVISLMDRLSAKVTEAVGAFDKAGIWEIEGASSMTAWLRHRARMSGGAASTMTRTARRLGELPVTAAAWLDGSLSSGQVQAVVANVGDTTIEMFAEHEAEVVPALFELSVADTATAMQGWAARAEALSEGPEPKERPRVLHLSKLMDGRRRLDGDLDGEGGSVVDTALGLATSQDAEGEEPRSPAERRADALVDICQFFLDHKGATPVGRARPHLNVVIDFDDLVRGLPGEFVEGGSVDPATIASLLCDSDLRRLITRGRSVILDFGVATRVVSDNLFSALVLRDRHCRHPGCDRPAKWCEAHHVIPVSEGGPTDLANLVLKCCRHHHLGHKPGWSEKVEPDGTFHITDPSGRTFITFPPGVGRMMFGDAA